LIDLINKYYLQLSGIYQKWYQPGQLFDAPSLYLITDKPMPVLSAKYDAKANNYSYEIVTCDASGFNTPQVPIQTLKVKSDERVTLVRCKMRPVIVLSQAADCWKDGKHQGDDCFLVAPVYSFTGGQARIGYSPDFVERVKSYVYNTFFYLPGSSSPFFKEGFVRFDRIQVVHKPWLQHKTVKLEGEVLECLYAWLYCYLVWGAIKNVIDLPPMCTLMLDYRDEKMKALGLVP
jgi:hypothetical protein